MTRRTVCAELPFVLILMTGETLRLQAEERFRFVALIALKRSVFSLKAISRLAVVERGLVYGPPDQCCVTSRMFRMTADAIGVTFGAVDDSGMVAAIVLDVSRDVRVTSRTLELSPSSPESVTLHALKSSFKAAVR